MAQTKPDNHHKNFNKNGIKVFENYCNGIFEMENKLGVKK